MTPPLDDIDTLLTRAGGAWRADQPAAPPVDPALFADRPPRRWQPAAAAAAVVLVVAAGATTAVALARDPAPTPSAGATTDPPPTGAFADLLVRDGDRVEVSGEVRAVPGQPVRLCAWRGRQILPPEPYCSAGVTLVGADLDALPGRTVQDGTVTGRARIEGRYAGGTVTVERQTAADPADPTPAHGSQPPCPTPEGGWKGPRTGNRGEDTFRLTQLGMLVDRSPDRYAGSWIAFASSDHEVPVVGTVGDVAAARRELAAAYTGDFCVVRAPRSATELNQVRKRLGYAYYAKGVGPHGRYEPGEDVGGDFTTGNVSVALIVVDESALGWLRTVDAGTGILDPVPLVRPLAATPSRVRVFDPTDLAAQQVADGDQVTAGGTVVAVPGRPVRVCPAGAAQADPARYCELGVTVTGVDLDTLPGRQEAGGVVWGTALLEGRYAGGAIAVRRQGQLGSYALGPAEEPAPNRICQAPPGGWKLGGPMDDGKLTAYLNAHPDQYLDRKTDIPFSEGNVLSAIPLIGTVLDPAVATARLEAEYGSTVCTYRVPHSLAEGRAALARATTADTQQLRSPAPFRDETDGYVVFQPAVVDAATLAYLQEFDAGTGIVSSYPLVRPAG